MATPGRRGRREVLRTSGKQGNAVDCGGEPAGGGERGLFGGYTQFDEEKQAFALPLLSAGVRRAGLLSVRATGKKQLVCAHVNERLLRKDASVAGNGTFQLRKFLNV